MQGTFDSNLGAIPAVKAVGTNGADAVTAVSDGTAIRATSDGNFAVVAATNRGAAVVANCVGDGIGLRAVSDGGWAINAQSRSGVAILGVSDTNVGVKGECQGGNNFGVVGSGPNAGVAAFNPTNDHAAYLASDCCAAWFTGGVTVTGRLSKGGGGFRIDHPLTPSEKYLSHSFVESSDMKNMYDGVVVADDEGKALITLPEWFEAINGEFRYQLTPVGASAPELHVADEISRGRFRIAGARPGMTVCWQVTGIRRDAWAQANRIVVEERKDLKERGNFLHPDLYGAAPTKSVSVIRHLRPGIR